MRRSALITAVALGALVCLLGGTVVYSALQDTARTGTNSAESAAMLTSANIQLATATSSGTAISCGTFSDDLASGLITATGLSPTFTSTTAFVCVRNIGSQPVLLSVLTDELTDVDFACTGDEAANGDATCGGDQAGELSSVLGVSYGTRSCANGGTSSAGFPTLKDNETTPHSFGTLASGATGCFSVFAGYPDTTATAAIQKAQSDRVTWRFKFSAQA